MIPLQTLQSRNVTQARSAWQEQVQVIYPAIITETAFLTICTGGWLAMMLGFGIGISACGLRIPQAPVAIAVFYPITDLPASSEQICSF